MSLWKFSFATTSSLDNLFTRETPPSLEEILDEQDILNEVKAQNNKLVSYLSNRDHIKGLLQWVVTGLDELDQAADAADTASFQYALNSPLLFPSYRAQQQAAVPRPGPDSPPLEPVDASEETNSEGSDSPGIFPGLGQGLGTAQVDEVAQRARYSQIATEILTSDLWSIPDTIIHNIEYLLLPFWDTVLPPLRSNTPSTDASAASYSRHEQTEKERARDEFWSDEDEERHRKQEAIRGMWTRINGVLLTKRPAEMVAFIRSLPNIIDRMFAHLESPSVQDMIVRLVSAEEAGVIGVIDWLASEDLINRLVGLMSPEYPPSTHLIAADLLKSIITLCAPTPFNPAGGNAMEQANQAQVGMRDNRLVRELASEQTLSILVGYMLDEVETTDKDWNGLGDGGGDGDFPGPNPADVFITHPLPSLASVTSSLTQICTILVELIRRNNSDFSEPHLFHTMRNRLMTIRMQRGAPKPDEEEEERSDMEDAMKEMSEKMGIVHLGNLLTVICRRFPDVHRLLKYPRSQKRAASVANPTPLTNERFRLIELYAELLHSSNMAILNRLPGTGPTYSSEGVLSGGLDSLEALGEAIDGDRAGEDDLVVEDQVTQARELPVSTGSTDASMSDVSDEDVNLDDVDEVSPSPASLAARTPELQEHHPPPPSQADVARLRDVMNTESRSTLSETSDMASVSHIAVAATTAAPSVASDEGLDNSSPSREPNDDDLPSGEKLKRKYLENNVIPTVVDIFFEYPNNDFAHHVIYDILQQVMNGRLTNCVNRDLAVQLVRDARLVERVMDASRVNDRLSTQPKIPRMPYMGHVSLLGQELVKFFIRCPPEVWSNIHDSFILSEWEAFVDGSLRETKDRDNRPLAGGKPMPVASAAAEANKSEDDSSDEEDESSLHKFGEPLSRTVAQDGYAHRGDGFDSYEDRQESGDEDEDAHMDWYRRTGQTPNRRHVDSSDEDDEDVDWLRPTHDDYASFQGAGTANDDFDDTDAWGDFTAASPSDGDASNPFDDFTPGETAPAAAAAAAPGAQLGAGPPLTPHDWASQFEREFSNENWATTDAESDADGDGDGDVEDAGQAADDTAPSIVVPDLGDDEEDDEDEDKDAHEDTTATPRAKTWTLAGDDNQGEDLPPTLSPVIEDTPILGTKSPLPVNKETPVITKAISALSLGAPKDTNGQLKRAPPPPPPSRKSISGASPSTAAKNISPSQSPILKAALGSSPITSSLTSIAATKTSPPKPMPPSGAVANTSPTVRAINTGGSNTRPIPMRSPAPIAIDIPDSNLSPVSSLSSSPVSPVAIARRRLSQGAFSPPQSSLISATSEEAPFGPGVSPDAHITPEGMMQRQVNGKVVTVPADEVVLGIEDARERQELEGGELPIAHRRSSSFGSQASGGGGSGLSGSLGRERSGSGSGGVAGAGAEAGLAGSLGSSAGSQTSGTGSQTHGRKRSHNWGGRQNDERP